MSSWFSFLSKSSKQLGDSEIAEIFPFTLKQDIFNRADILATYTKILTDTVERTHGITKKVEPLLWDSCVQSEVSEGLVTMLAQAMTDKSDLFLVYSNSVGILRKATHEEQQKIRADYEKDGESTEGVYISFKHYRRTDMLTIYSNLEYCVLASLNKTLNISKAVQIKINDLRASVSLNDSEIARSQARSIAQALGNGSDVMIDSEDTIETATPDTSSTEKAISFLDAKRAYILGLPIAYVSGLQTPGIGSTGEADMRATERGLKQYFVSIIQPVLKEIFKIETEFKSQDFRQMTTALEVLKTFDLVSDENMSRDAKREIIARVFDLDFEKEEKLLEEGDDERDDESDTESQTNVVPGLTTGNNNNGS